MASLEDVVKNLDSKIKTLKALANTVNKNPLKNSLVNGLTELQSISKSLTRVEKVEEKRAQDEIDFGDFLSDIGDSIVETQQKLDGKSKKYLSEIKGNTYIQPSVFRIPKVSAEIKFGMTKSKGKGFNIIIAKRSNEEETTLNQSMQFEILSVPPPPDFQQAFYGEVPAIGFVFSPGLRASVFNDIERCEPKVKSMELLMKNPDRVLILELHPKTKENLDDFLLLYGETENEKDVGIWHLRRDPNPNLKKAKKPVFSTILKFTLAPRAGENYQELRDFVNKFSKLQQKLI